MCTGGLVASSVLVASHMSRRGSEVDGLDGDLDGNGSDDEKMTTARASTTKRGRDRGATQPQQCHACLGAGGLNKKFHGFMLHSHCFSAVRSRHRQLRGVSKASVDADLSLMSKEPTQWRSRLELALDAETRHESRRAAREEAQRFEETATVSRNTVVRDKLELTKVRYKAFVKKWDCVLEDEASSDFERLLTEQDRSDTVLVPDIVRHREEAGEEDRRGYRREPRAGRSGDDSDRPRQSPHPGRRRGRSPPFDPPSGPRIPRSARPSRSRSRVSRVPETSPRDEEKDLSRGRRQKSLREDLQFEFVAFMEKRSRCRT